MIAFLWIAALLACDDSVVIQPSNQAPVALILTPADDEDVDAPVAFTARVSANGDAPPWITWESDVDGILDEGDAPSDELVASFPLSPGPQTIVLTVTDSTGSKGEDTVNLNVRTP